MIRTKAIVSALILVAAPCLRATIGGFNQIVTPDIQPEGSFSIGALGEDKAIGDQGKLQLELGLTPWLGAAYYQGVSPSEGLVAAEASLLAKGPHLVTVGFVNWSTRGGTPQPFLEYGYYGDKDHFVVGGIVANKKAEVPLGYTHNFTDKLCLVLDYQTGSENYSTVGFTYNFTPNFQVNPAVYLNNSKPRSLRWYLVFTVTTQLWKPAP